MANQSLGNVSMPSRDSINATQIHSLLNIAGMLMPYILEPAREPENVPSSRKKIDGEAAMAAQVTFIKVCDRLDKLVEENDRWTFDVQRTLETDLSNLYQHHTTLIKEQIIATKAINLPHNRFRPTLYALKDGNYAAVLGSIDDLDNAIAAVGDSPAAALHAWDMLFKGELPPGLFDWLKQREAALDSGKTPPPMPKTKKKK
jgi:hypothetical protein